MRIVEIQQKITKEKLAELRRRFKKEYGRMPLTEREFDEYVKRLWKKELEKVVRKKFGKGIVVLTEDEFFGG